MAVVKLFDMAIRYTDPEPTHEKAEAKKRPAEKIKPASPKGEKEPAKWHFRKRVENGTFDRKTYMREYMRSRRKQEKERDQ